jgi:hypothetical protein
MEAPFRLALLATHPLSGGWARETWRRGAINPKSCLPLLAGGGGPRSGGRGRPLQAADACEAGIRTLSKERVPSNIKGHPPSFTIALMPPSVSLCSPPTPQVGVGKKKMDAPFRLAALATHPLSGGGQEKHGGKEELTQTLVSSAEL